MIWLRRLGLLLFALELFAAFGTGLIYAQGPGGSTGNPPVGATNSKVGGATAIQSTGKTTAKRHKRTGPSKKQAVAKAAPSAAPSSAPAPAPSSDTFFEQGNDYYDRGLYSEAVQAYKRALELKPDDAEAYSYLGDAYFRQTQYEDAIAAYREAVRLNPADTASLYSLADSYANLRRTAEADTAYKQADQQFLADDRKNGKVVSAGVLNSRATSLPKPETPPIAKAARVGGAVMVQVIVDENGDVAVARPISGHPLLQAAGVAAAREAKFSPMMVSGQPVKVTGVLTITFN